MSLSATRVGWGVWARCAGSGSSIRSLAKIEEWVERSHAKIRADRAFDKLKALGFAGSDRTVRRAVAEVKANHRRGRRRVYRPWIPEPGMWAQWDWGTGPVIAGRRTNLFCAWLAWSRFRVVIATWDRTLPTVVACVDRAMRAFGGAPTYWLTDNERTVTIDHVAGVPVRHPEMVAVGGHYGITVATCVPADPESKGGSEATVRVVTHCAPSGPIEVARHQRSTPGHPMIDDAHYPARPAGPLGRRPKPTSAAEAEFLALGEGARLWLVEAASAGTSRIKTKMAQAVTLARLHGQIRVDWALGHAATYARFADGDLASILAAHPVGERHTASEDHSLQPGTAAWGRLGGDQ